tara:strand:+ start:83 stop:529 length:447 start_codon:yes stop_codon:yes gene_type:complete
MNNRLCEFINNFLYCFIKSEVFEKKTITSREGNALFNITVRLLNKNQFLSLRTTELFSHVIALVFKEVYTNHKDYKDRAFRSRWFKNNNKKFIKLCTSIYEEWIYRTIKPFNPLEIVYSSTFPENNEKCYFDNNKSHAIYRSIVKYLE